jgi:outer membrane protein assembly factor BamC
MPTSSRQQNPSAEPTPAIGASTKPPSIAAPLRLALGATVAGALALTSGCSTISDTLAGEKLDYRTSGKQTVRLDVPPDLSQLPGQQRYGQVQTASVSANSLVKQDANGDDASSTVKAVSPTEVGNVKLENDGKTRWLVVNESPDQVWEKVRTFWTDAGFELSTDSAQTGVMETNWSENRAKVPKDGLIRQTLGRVFDVLYDTGERDMYRTRIERTAKGSEIYISHRGMSEEYEDSRKERTTWRGRPSDPGLEAEMLRKLMVKLGAPAATAAAAIKPDTSVTIAPVAGLAKLNADGVSMTVDGEPELAWRRVGLALDRSGFTVENRDRKQGSYEVRLSDSDVEANKPGFFSRIFGGSKTDIDGLRRYKVTVQGQGTSSLVNIVDEKGQPAKGDVPRRIAKQIIEQHG